MKYCSFRFILTFALICFTMSLRLYSQDARPHAQDAKLIRNIEIIRHDVFPEITGKPEFIYNWANRLHIVTKENIIRNELLFKPGDVYDPELLEESERNIRRLAYIGEVKITPIREEAGFVDVSVVTQDQWSTLVSSIIRGGGGRTTLGVSIEEFNLLGFGKQVFSEISHEPEGFNFILRYTDPLLFGSRWTTLESFETGPFKKGFSAQLIWPFFSLDTKWAGGISGSLRDDTIRLFQAGDEVSRFGFESDEVRLFIARALGRRFHKTRFQLTYRFSERDFTTIEGKTTTAIPQDELIHSLSLGFSLENLSFVEEKQIDKFLRTEDLTLGNITSLSLGRTGLPIPTGVKRFEFSFRRREAHKIFDKHYLFAMLGVQTLFERDTIASLRLRYYNKLFQHQTLAFNLEFDYGIDLEESRQFILGGETGLRGYPAREFTGAKRFLINMEDRLFTSVNLLTVALGGVVFVDAGNVWEGNQAIDLRDLNYSVGFGLRLGYTKSPNSRVGRIDFAWPLTRGGGFIASFGVDQQFTVN